jgi:hypothetical protein
MKLGVQVGTRFGRYVVLSQAKSDANRHIAWLCKCDCGAVRRVRQSHLVSGESKGCGCARLEVIIQRSLKHGHCCITENGRQRSAPEYHAWQSMLQRCYLQSMPFYLDYGGRGITVCDQWRHDFSKFLADVGYRPSPKHTLDRIDNNGNYEPGNVRWATRKEQARNRRNNRLISIDGQTRCLAEWCEIFNTSVDRVLKRLLSGMPPEVALTLPFISHRLRRLRIAEVAS